ncbi:hypothetical protein BpHYR1_052141 [Brachionus plicatilis]|uniref:Uncharacterized protein n=1 Tax=Brachionus plicatilis TaxID=10195 RepID=A0A3M7R4I5_BRAPC|nr:hypothetical protein BpHYR1_052141 [Brachionus plicatilis]
MRVKITDCNFFEYTNLRTKSGLIDHLYLLDATRKENIESLCSAMETPTNDRSRPRLSSSQKKNRNSLDNSASKRVRTLIHKEKIRKLNHYKSAKSKRAEIRVKNRHIDNLENVDQEEIDYSECENEFQMKDCQSMDNQVQIVNGKPEPLEEIKPPVLNSTQGISSKISSTLVRRINSLKNSIKNIVTPNDIKSSKPLNVKQHSVDNGHQGSKSNKLRRSISVGGFPSSCQVNKPSQMIKPLKKQESTSSVQFTRPMSSSLANSKVSSFSSSSSLSFRSHHNSSSSLSGKPVFKVSTKIRYNDSHLYKNDMPVDKNKNQKLIPNRKGIATSSGSLNANKNC